MPNSNDSNLSDEIIGGIGLVPTNKQVNSTATMTARVFEYPHLDNVFIMENDLYGNVMPKGSCFLAFYGTHGLIGRHLYVETLFNASKAEIEAMALGQL